MKLSLVLAAAALAIPGLAAAVTAAPEITGVITPGHRQPFKPLPKNGTTHGLVNTTGSAVQTGAPVRSVWRPFADNPIQSPSRFKTGAAAFMAADVASQATPDSAQVPPQKLAKGKRDTFKKTALQNEGNNDPEEGTGIDKNKNDAVRRTAPHEIINLPTDLGTRSVGGKRPWARPSVGVDKGKAKQASAVVPKNASRKFRDALASKKAKASPQAPWTKMFDHRKGKTSSSPSDRKAKKTTRKNKTTRRSLAIAANVTSREPPETLSSDDTPPAPHPNQRRASDTPFGIKKGIVYQDGAVTPSFSRDGSATWAYNWGAAPGAPMFQQIPMFWGPRDKGDAAGVMALVRAGAPWVLGYNEPDMVWQGGGGCEVSAGEAYNTWGVDMFPFYNEGARLVCPAVTSWNSTHGATNGPSGLVWLHEFVGYTTKPTDLLCGAQALHWYGVEGKSGAEQADLFTTYVALAHDEINALFGFDMPLWITEFAAMPLSDAQVMAEFLDVALPWLDQQEYVERYSPFMADNMVDGQQLNVAGEKFVTWRGGAD